MLNSGGMDWEWIHFDQFCESRSLEREGAVYAALLHFIELEAEARKRVTLRESRLLKKHPAGKLHDKSANADRVPWLGGFVDR